MQAETIDRMAASRHLWRVAGQVEIFGTRAFTPDRDQTAMSQAPRGKPGEGRWQFGRGRQVRGDRCEICGGRPKPNEYCGGCSMSGHTYRGPYTITYYRDAAGRVGRDGRPSNS